MLFRSIGIDVPHVVGVVGVRGAEPPVGGATGYTLIQAGAPAGYPIFSEVGPHSEVWCYSEAVSSPG